MQRSGPRAIRNPGSYYFDAVEPSDWTTPHNDVLWQNTVKTLFDPCPSGWRVPQNGEGANNPWSGFATVEAPWTDDGRRWSAPLVSGGQAWYAATGLRFYSGGVMTGVNNSVHCQSAAPVPGSNSARVFYFTESETIINRSAHRTHGLSVRCVRE